jgi:murein DD-endopeptidase MepM/ murein hydrolase activator NlpD
MRIIPKKAEFWKEMRFKYKLSFLNENTLEEVFALRLSRLSGLLTVLIFVVFLIAFTAIVIIKTPIRNYLPGYLDSEIRQEMILNALRADSIQQQLLVQSKYLNNVNAILRGDMEVDKIHKVDSIKNDANVNLEKSKRTAEFVRDYEEEERYNLTATQTSQSRTDNAFFYKPVQGVVSSNFNLQEKHYGIDIAAKPKEPVLATMKGTVIYTGFDPNYGYVITVQHSNGFVSVYKHNALLLKKEGEEVNSGDVVALVGNTGSLSTGDHLHFEIWYKGKPVDPREYINFN